VIVLLTNALFPVFAGLVLGYAAGLHKVVDNVNVKSLITFLMTFALPCALFSTISHTSHVNLFGQTRLVAVLAVVYLVTYGAVFYFTRLDTSSDRAVMALTLAFPNATAVGLPLLAAAYGPPGSVACASAIAIGAVTISPITLAILESANSPVHHSFARRLGSSMFKAVMRPVVWSPVLAIVVVLFHVSLPTYLDRTLTILGGATAGVALFLTGLVVSAQRFRFTGSMLAAVLAKNILQPALCLGVAILLHLPIEATRYVVLICAIPCGFFGIVFGKGFGASPEVASSGLIASYVVGVVTLAGWMVLLGRLG
jgi:malonate transporter and related proteins